MVVEVVTDHPKNEYVAWVLALVCVEHKDLNYKLTLPYRELALSRLQRFQADLYDTNPHTKSRRMTTCGVRFFATVNIFSTAWSGTTLQSRTSGKNGVYCFSLLWIVLGRNGGVLVLIITFPLQFFVGWYCRLRCRKWWHRCHRQCPLFSCSWRWHWMVVRCSSIRTCRFLDGCPKSRSRICRTLKKGGYLGWGSWLRYKPAFLRYCVIESAFSLVSKEASWSPKDRQYW